MHCKLGAMWLGCLLSVAAWGADEYHQGLIGAWYHGHDLTRIGSSSRRPNLDMVVDAGTGHGIAWSAQWVGVVAAPETGTVTFHGQSNRELIVEVAGQELVHLGQDNSKESGSIEMEKGKNYPINVKYLQPTGGEAYFKVLWSWAGQDQQIVPPGALRFTIDQAKRWNYVEKPDPQEFDFSKLNTIPVKNGFAYREAGRFAGWPANNGAWIWGNEILVGFERGYHDPHSTGGHAIRGDKPSHGALARSLDGGVTWKTEEPDNFVDDEGDQPDRYKNCPGIDFAHPNFAMRIGGRRFFVSYDRGKTWEGAYRIDLRGIEIGDLTSRTDYLVLGPQACLVFMSGETGLVESNYQDRSFCARTDDGGKTFQFQGWMTHDTNVRSVMSSTVEVGEQHLVAVMRRKHEETFESRPTITRNWIEAAQSTDEGKTWKSLGKVAETDLGDHNGNPPALVKLPDDRLCVAYGYRDFPYGIRMKISDDNGQNWSHEIALRSDGGTWDLGYPRMVVRPDGRVVVMYYYNTREIPAQHIGVSTWDPAQLK